MQYHHQIQLEQDHQNIAHHNKEQSTDEPIPHIPQRKESIQKMSTISKS